MEREEFDQIMDEFRALISVVEGNSRKARIERVVMSLSAAALKRFDDIQKSGDKYKEISKIFDVAEKIIDVSDERYGAT